MMRSFLVACLALFIAAAGPALAAPGQPYALGPQDKLRIKVYEWRPGSGEAYQWAALSGEFAVSAGGELSLPLVGQLGVAGKTLQQTADLISEALKSKLGLAKGPEISIEVAEYRPFFVSGLVTKPGQYPYMPGLTVQQAVSIAGGIVRPLEQSTAAAERDAVTVKGELRSLDAEYLDLIARRARLEAELAGVSEIAFPSEITARVTQADIQRLMAEQKQLFAARRASLASRQTALAQNKELLSREITALNAKAVALQHQLDLVTKELDSVNALVAKGLAVSSRQLALEQNVAQFQSNKLDLNLLILRAQQDLTKTDRDLADLQNQFHDDVLTKLQEIGEKIAINVEKRDTARALIFFSENTLPRTLARDRQAHSDQRLAYSITRRTDGQQRVMIASELEDVMPGDVVQVYRLPDSSDPEVNAPTATR